MFFNLPLNNIQIICKQNLTGALHDPDFEECQVKGTVYWQKKIELKAISSFIQFWKKKNEKGRSVFNVQQDILNILYS